MNKEVRNYDVEFRSSDDSRHIEGYAIVFDSLSEDMGYREIIDREALTQDIINSSDILCLMNHDESRGVLARSKQGKGSLSLEIDEVGLKYSFDAPKTALGDELLEAIKRGDISQSSFAFTVDKEEWSKDVEGVYIRTIKKFKRLFDVSPVYHPAYSATSVDTRGLDEFKAMEIEETKAYYNELRKQIEK